MSGGRESAPTPKVKLYQPSNGTEGMWFDEQFCSKCSHDYHYRETGEPAWGCPIAAFVFIYDTTDPEYPNFWRYDDEGKPCCYGFSPLPKQVTVTTPLEEAQWMLSAASALGSEDNQ